MLYSKLFGKTTKEVSTEINLTSHKLLFKAGFIRESVAGRYYFLPLGIRVRDKLMKIIAEEMDKSGAQKMITPTLHPIELWEESNRTSSVGFELMQIEDQRGAKFALGGTAEEMIVDLVRKFNISYKDLPFNIYQFSQKFRDEKRARGGLLRTREFMMKDAYSFHANPEDFKKEYDKMAKVYTSIFDRVGLKTYMIESDNGYIGGDYCHEFVVLFDIGESKFLMTKDGSYAAHEDVVCFAREGVNMDEEEKEFKIIEQPKWVKTMDDNVKHYGLDKSHFLKNVVYKNHVTGEIIIAGIRGDLDVSKIKLEQNIDAVGMLDDATDEDLEKLGTKSGYVHSWGHDARYIGDLSLTSVKNFIGGQKEDETDSMNVNYGRDFTCEKLCDIAVPKKDVKTENGKELIEKKGIEVGNIFQLGTHYSSKMSKALFTDSDGKEKPYYMGCYGIGVGRTLATIVEEYNDDYGIIWPKDIAPYQVHLLHIGKSEEVKKATEKLYKELLDHGIEVLYDDRDERPGTKLNDADLIGNPVRILISDRSFENNKAELKLRTEKDVSLVEISEIISRVDEILKI